MADHLWGFYPGTYDRLWAARRDLAAANKTLESLNRQLKDCQESSNTDCDRQIAAVRKWIQEAQRRKTTAEVTIQICNQEIRSGKVIQSYQEFR